LHEHNVFTRCVPCDENDNAKLAYS